VSKPGDYTIKDSGQRAEFEGGGHRDTEDDKVDYTLAFDGPMFERYAVHLTKGAKKYEPRNWMLFTDQAALERAQRSLARHFVQYQRGDEDEDHAAAIIFNLNVIERIKEMRHSGFVRLAADLTATVQVT
jgi:Domain of unknown function (DUF5664)